MTDRSASIEYRVLGPLEAVRLGEPVPLGGAKQRGVLALLLSRGGEIVPASRLIDEIWAEYPPATAGNLLQGYVAALRKVLGKDAIATRGTGYALLVDDASFDLRKFERLSAAGGEALAAGHPDEASAAFADGLALWRGPSLADLADEPFARPIAARLDELRLFALERRLQADLDCGRSAQVLAELVTLTWEYPLHERFRGLHMQALYRCGRQAEALEVFRRGRATMVEQAGIEPGPALHALAQAILRQDQELLGPGGEAPAAAGAADRVIILACVRADALDSLVAIAEPLVALGGHELVLARTVESAGRLPDAVADLHARRDVLLARGVPTRVAAFVSSSPGPDLARLAREQDADLLAVDAPRGSFDDARVRAMFAEAPCDVAVHFGGAPGPGPVLVPFSGVDHDWAAVEIGAWLAKALRVPLHLGGASADPSGKDASRLLANASLAVQRTLGVAASPLLVDPSPAALVAAASGAGIVAVGLPGRWPHAGLGAARTALTAPGGPPALLVRRGLRPGGLAPSEANTRFTWTLLPDPR